MQVLDLEQNTSEWEAFRRKHIGASDSPTICGVNPYKSPYKLWKEKAMGEKDSLTHAMMEGHRLEAAARELAQVHWEMQFPPLCVLHSSINHLMASLDGYNKDRGVALEIKVVGENTYEKVLQEGPLLSWFYQVNHQMECTESEITCLFVMHRDTHVYQVFSLIRNDGIIKEILEKDAAFYERLLNFDPPEDDDVWRNAAETFLKAKEASLQAEEHLKTCKQHLIEISGSASCRGHGVSTTKYFSKGSVDYSKIPEIKGLDLTPYRKPSKEIWRVS
jgi:putative phage-type endonuclease